MSDEALHTAGLSGDHGWNEAEEVPMHVFSTALLVAATGAVWGSVWLLSGVPPLLSSVVNRVARSRAMDAGLATTGEGGWRSNRS